MFPPGFTCPAVLWILLAALNFAYVTLTLFGSSSHKILLALSNTKCSPKHRVSFLSRFSLFRFRSPLLSESRLISFPRPT